MSTMGGGGRDATDRPAAICCSTTSFPKRRSPASANSSARLPASWKMPWPASTATGTWRPDNRGTAGRKNGPGPTRLVHRHGIVLADVRPRIAHRLADDFDAHGPLGHVEFRRGRPAGRPLDEHDPGGPVADLRGSRASARRRQDSQAAAAVVSSLPRHGPPSSAPTRLPARRYAVIICDWWASTATRLPRTAIRSPHHSFGHLRHGDATVLLWGGWKGPVAQAAVTICCHRDARSKPRKMQGAARRWSAESPRFLPPRRERRRRRTSS